MISTFSFASCSSRGLPHTHKHTGRQASQTTATQPQGSSSLLHPSPSPDLACIKHKAPHYTTTILSSSSSVSSVPSPSFPSSFSHPQPSTMAAAPGRLRASTSSSTSSNTHTSVGSKLAAFLPSLPSFRRASTRTLKFEVTVTIHCLLHYPQSGRLFVKVKKRGREGEWRLKSRKRE